MKSRLVRIATELDDDIRAYKNQLMKETGISNISLVEASRKYAKLNKRTVLRITK